MSLWHILAGSPRTAPSPTPVDLDAIAIELTNRLGVLVVCTHLGEANLVEAEILLTGQAFASLPQDKIINRLERQLQRAAALIRLD
jgi:hypothetical protein